MGAIHINIMVSIILIDMGLEIKTIGSFFSAVIMKYCSVSGPSIIPKTIGARENLYSYSGNDYHKYDDHG